MKKFLFIFILSISFSLQANAQKFETHTVKDGETIETISKRYKVTVADIYALNPDAKTRLSSNMVLIIPSSKTNGVSPKETKELIGYDSHKVKRKETLFGIAKKYNISIDDIKKHNRELYSDNLKKGDKIRIPKYKTIVNRGALDNTIKTYTVLPKEGKWRVAYKFGITVEQLEALNPNINEVLQPGDIVNVPNISGEEEKPVEPNYSYYEVLPKEGYFRLKIKLGLTQEQLETLNPELKVSGLKQGMVLKIPLNTNIDGDAEDVQTTNLSKNLKNLSTKRIALLLPFKLNKIDIDSVAEAKSIIKSDKMMSVALDFHSGVLMALDSAKQLGISTNLKVFDTENQQSEVSKILSNNDFSKYDAVIGPVMAANFDKVARALKDDNIPVLSPLMKPSNIYDNVFQTIPNDDLLEKTMLNFVKKDSINRSVVIISDEANRTRSNRIKAMFPQAKQIFSSKDKNGKDAYFIYAKDLVNVFRSGKNYVFLETSNAGLALNVTSLLNGLTTTNQDLVLVTTNKTDAFENEHVSNFHLSNLKFHYPSINKSFDSEKSDIFVKKYKKVYGYEPNKYAVRGYDLMLDVLMRLASDDNLYKASTNEIETEYIENKFRYSKKMMGGFYNEAVYILKYEDLTIKEDKQ